MNGVKLFMGAPVYVEMVKFHEKSTSPASWGTKIDEFDSLTRIAPPHRAPEVTRRDGSSSWRVIFFVAVGMLSGKSAVNYV